MTRDRLHALDATFLTAEEPRSPLNIASLAIFEPGALCDERGAVRVDAICARIEPRLGLLPRLRQRVADVPFGLDFPVWIDDEHFDLANHVDAVELESPGDDAALIRLTEDLMMQPLDRNRPLWHMRFVSGLRGGRVAVIERAHHSMVDGVSGVDVSLVLLDTEPDAPDPVAPPWTPQPAPTAGGRFADAIGDRISEPIRTMWKAGAAALRSPLAAARTASGVLATASTLWNDGLLAPESSLNEQIGSARRLDAVRQPVDTVRAAGRDAGGTINDVVLTAVAGGVRALLLGRGETIGTDQKLKILVPVSVRTGAESMALGNRVGALLMPLPIGIGDPRARLDAVAATTRHLKQSTEASTADLLVQAANLFPTAVARRFGRGLHHQRLINMIVTNVPGPPFPLYALGCRMLEATPIVPLGGNMTVEVAVLSYDGTLTLGITSDRDTCPDVDTFVHGIDRSFEQLGVSWVPTETRLRVMV
jgi:WS/DGAT/MGAT family acyltransferase